MCKDPRLQWLEHVLDYQFSRAEGVKHGECPNAGGVRPLRGQGMSFQTWFMVWQFICVVSQMPVKAAEISHHKMPSSGELCCTYEGGLPRPPTAPGSFWPSAFPLVLASFIECDDLSLLAGAHPILYGRGQPPHGKASRPHMM